MDIALVSLGCNKNLVDSEMILGMISKRGYNIVAEEEKADIIIINTCAFIHDAKQESINAIIEMGQLKKGRCKGIIVTGCLAKRYENEIKNELPEVDCIAGINDYNAIIDFIDSKSNEKSGNYEEVLYTERIRSTFPHTAYVKIADGCNNNCTYCVIPAIRGKYISRTIEDIENEVRVLADEGVKEIILIAQDTAYYGIDIYKERSLAKLLDRLDKIEGIRWIRVLYVYPEGITDELLQIISRSDKICKYFDIPIQHINNDILKRMNRKTSKERIIELIEKIRNLIPNVVLRTSLIVGFPGETEEQFTELKTFVENACFDKLGVFEYSREEGTPAARLKEQISKKIKKDRRESIMQTQQIISSEKNKKIIGKEMEVLIEGKLSDQAFFGRTYKDAPEIDGYAFVESEEEIPIGSFIKAKVIAGKEYDIIMKKY